MGKLSSNLAVTKKRAPLPIKLPPTGSNVADDSTGDKVRDSSSDDPMDVPEEPTQPASTFFGCPIEEEPYHTP